MSFVLSSARSRLSSSTSFSTSTTSTAVSAVRRTATAATCSKKTTALYHNLARQNAASSLSTTTTTVSPTTYDGCLSRNNKHQLTLQQQDVVMKVRLMSHTKQQQRIKITQQQQEQSQGDEHRPSSPQLTTSNNLYNLDIGTDSSSRDTSNNNENNNNSNDNKINKNHSNHNEYHFSRPYPSSLLRLCEFNRHHSSSCSSSKLLTQFSHYHQHQHQHQHHLSSSSLSLTSSMMMLLTMPALCSSSRFCSSSSSSSQPSSSESGSNDDGNQNEKQNENIDENDKIDVPSFADSAKNILQAQKIGELIFNENRTVAEIIPSSFFSLEPFIKHKIISSEEDLYDNKNRITVALSVAQAMRAIDFKTQNFPKSLSTEERDALKENRMLVLAINMHPKMSEMMEHAQIAAKLNSLQIITVYDWYMSVAEARQELEPSQVELINRRCAASYRKAKEENKRKEQIRTCTENLDAKVNVDPALLPGKSHRYTEFFGFGVLARDKALEDLSKSIAEFAEGKKEDLPLFIIRSMPRQGKTRLGDELGYRKNIYGNLNGATANDENTFIFNLTFNTNWEVKQLDQAKVSAAVIKASEKNQNSNIQRAIDRRVVEEEKKQRSNTGSKDVSVVDSDKIRKQVEEQFKVNHVDDKELLIRVEKELCRRVVAAAAGIFSYGRYQKSDLRLFCEDFIEAHDFDFRKVCVQVQHLVATKRKKKTSEVNFVFVFDEITNLEEKLNGKIALKAHFYSCIASLIDSQCAVLLSGFSEAKEALSMSGRNVETIILSPVSSVDLRRELHTMKTKFFNLLAVAVNAEQSNANSSSSTSSQEEVQEEEAEEEEDEGKKPAAENAIFFYELVKSAPGLFGTLLEYLRTNPATPLGTIVHERIPAVASFLKEIKACHPNNNNKNNGLMMPPLLESMFEILQLKSLLFWSPHDTDVSSTSSFYFMLVHRILNRAIQNKVVDASVSGQGLKDLYSSRLEPLFLHVYLESVYPAFFEQSSGLQQYWTKLKLFSQIASRITNKRRIIGKDLRLVLSGFQGQLDNKTETRIEKYMNNTPKAKRKNKREDLNGYFFEDAIGDGLLFQRQLRRELTNNSKENIENLDKNSASHSSTLRQYLDGSRVICSIQTKNAGNLRRRQRMKQDGTPLQGFVSKSFPEGRILWSKSSSSSSSSSSTFASIVEFEGHFPCQPRHNNPNEQLQQTLRKRKSNNVTNEQCDSLDHVLRPRRINMYGELENNPLVDVIINERFQDSQSESKNSDELVQFWIDGKHKKDSLDILTKDDSTYISHSHLRGGLQEIADRIENDCSKVRHIVHIIICPFRRNNDKHEAHVGILRRGIVNNISLPAPLESYTLCFVSPDDLSENKAFENLVSQPIALTVPLVEQQMTDSWTHSLPPPREWWQYNATDGCRSRVRDRLEKRKGISLDQKREENLLHKWCPVASRMSIPGDFEQWRGIRFNGDCAVGIGHLFKTEKEASDNLSFEGDIKKEPHRSLEIPFGCILEALGILPARAHGTSYCAHDRRQHQFRLYPCAPSATHQQQQQQQQEEQEEQEREQEQKRQYFEIVVANYTDSTSHLVVDKERLKRSVRVGHILRFNYEPKKKSDKSNNNRAGRPEVVTWRPPKTVADLDYYEPEKTVKLWDHIFAHHEKASVEKFGKDFSFCEEEQKTILTCSDIWNMSLAEFADVLLKGQAEQHRLFNELFESLLQAARKITPTSQSTGDIEARQEQVCQLATFVSRKLEKFEFVK